MNSLNIESKPRPKPILMTPIRCCGARALCLQLNASVDFYSPYPMHLVDFMPLVSLYGDLDDDWAYFQLTLDLVGLQNATIDKWDSVALDPVKIFEAVKDSPRSVHRIAWEILFQAGQIHRAKVVMDKSVDNVYYAWELIELFDDLLFLNVVRDPRVQIDNINKATIYDYDLLLNTMSWVKAHQQALTIAKQHPERVLTIRYEDFLSDPETVLRQICQFFEIEFIDSTADVGNSGQAKNISVLPTLDRTNSVPIPADIDKFEQSMSMKEIEMIETIAGNLMDFYGYEKMTPAAANVSSKAIASAKKRSVLKKQRAWLQLKENEPRHYQLVKFRFDHLEMVKKGLLEQQIEDLNRYENSVSTSIV